MPWRLTAPVAVATALFAAQAGAPLTTAPAWPAWQRFSEAFVQDDGRVVDWTADARTVSEAQGYALFFALVANDRARFQSILGWTQTHLAGGDLRQHLPAWLWGRDDHDRWRVLDANSASDSDLWLAYDLLEAGRLWRRADYTETGRALLRQIAATEVIRFADRTVLLPGANGFFSSEGARLNPSYLPPFQLDYFASVDPKGPWRALLDDFLSLLPDLAPSGAVPDWFVLTGDGARKDVASDGIGGYDAIRVYLWAGIGAASGRAQPNRALKPFAEFIRRAGRVPEHWYPDGRAPTGAAPAAFEAALLPFLYQVDAGDVAEGAQKRIASETSDGFLGKPARYYEQALSLFGQGWKEQRYRLDNTGRLKPQWHD